MNTMDLLTALTRAPTDARIVLQLPNGDEVEVTDAQHHCQLVVLRADVPEPVRLDNSVHIEEAMLQSPESDFLEEVIKLVRGGSYDHDDLLDMLEEVQSDVARATEYGRDELRKALAEIEQ